MSKYKPYPKYKDSGMEWLGQVPEEWQALQLKHICRFAYGNALSQDVRCDGLVPVYGSNGIVGVHNFPNTKAPVVIVGRKGSFGKVSYSEKPVFVIDTAYFIDRNTTTYPLRWVYYMLQTLELDAVSKDTGVPGLSREDTYSKVAPLPENKELDAISSFLDHETAHIDSIINKQEHLVELLEEKRISIISHAVTKGMNPDAPMKDSGVEWLGQVPAHWELKKLKYFATFSGGGTPSRDNIGFWGGNIPWVSPKDMKSERIISSEEFITEEGLSSSATSLQSSGQILIVVRSGILRHTIPVAINEVPVALNQDMKAIKPLPEKCLNSFLVRWIQGFNAQLILAWGKQGATVESIEHAYLAETCVPLPPLCEQQSITAFLDRELSKIDTIINKTRQAIVLAQERRAAIISAAVTGKICVSRPQSAEKPLSKSREYFQKVVLAAEITNQLHQERTFGRVKLQKILYLSEYHAQLPFQRSAYQRYAAGPHDPKAMYSIEGQMKKQKWFDSRLREGGYGKEYVPLERHEAYKQYYERYFADKHEAIQRIIDLLRPKDTQFCEVVATLYGVWNDFLLEGQQPDDTAMFREAVTNWAPEKKKVPPGLWPKALSWMRENRLVPSGWGEPTIHRQEI